MDLLNDVGPKEVGNVNFDEFSRAMLSFKDSSLSIERDTEEKITEMDDWGRSNYRNEMKQRNLIKIVSYDVKVYNVFSIILLLTL